MNSQTFIEKLSKVRFPLGLPPPEVSCDILHSDFAKIIPHVQFEEDSLTTILHPNDYYKIHIRSDIVHFSSDHPFRLAPLHHAVRIIKSTFSPYSALVINLRSQWSVNTVELITAQYFKAKNLGVIPDNFIQDARTVKLQVINTNDFAITVHDRGGEFRYKTSWMDHSNLKS